MNINSQFDRSASTAQNDDRRRSQRVILRIPVTLQLIGSADQSDIAAHTVAVNVHGAMVVCARPFEPGTKVQIQNNLTRERVSGSVTRASRESHEGHLVPIEFEKASPSFWQIVFPPVSE